MTKHARKSRYLGEEARSLPLVTPRSFNTPSAREGIPTTSPQHQHNFATIPTFYQPKLTVNTPGDIYEQEADEVAEQVMQMSELSAAPIQRSIAPRVQRCEACGTSHANSHEPLCPACAAAQQPEHLQAREAPGATPAVTPKVEGQIDALRGGGQALDAQTRGFMEPRFGHNFANVRVHADTRAVNAARAVNALAFTVGRDIAFGAGQYQPGSDVGRRLLAHELTHVVQQKHDQIQLMRPDIMRSDNKGNKSRESKPKDAPRGTKPIDQSGLDKDQVHDIKDGVGAGPRDWTGISPEGHVITSDEDGNAVDHGDWGDYTHSRYQVPEWLWKALAGVALAAGTLAVIACFAAGPCSIGTLIAGLGYATAMIIFGLLKDKGGSESTVASKETDQTENSQNDTVGAYA